MPVFQNNMKLCHFDQGVVFARQGDYSKALIEFTCAITEDSNHKNPYYNRGLIYSDLKQWDNAIADYSKVLELDPRDTSALEKRGSAHALKGDIESAIADYEACISIEPHSVFALNLPDEYYFWANNLLMDEKYNKAIIIYSHIISRYPDFCAIGHVYCTRAKAYFNIKEYDKARSDLVEAEARAERYSGKAKKEISGKIEQLTQAFKRKA